MLYTNPLEFPDSFKKVCDYLEPPDLSKLRQISRSVNTLATSPLIWQPYLSHLKAIDKRISLTPPEGNQQDWYYHRFLKGFEHIYRSQQTEIQYFRNFSSELPKTPLVQAPLKRLLALSDTPANSLQAIKERDDVLEKLNTAIIESRIDITTTSLNLCRCHLTRFPSNLFSNIAYKEYWQALERLYCQHNRLRFFPLELGNCKKLQVIICFDNLLTSLPHTLGKCKRLERIHCFNNKIRSLPPSLGKCPIQKLDCSSNLIQFIPDTLGNCPLIIFDCSNNNISSLPSTLGKCLNLKELICFNNLLEFIPRELKNCLSLMRLDCSENLITDLPSELSVCSRIQILCNNNKLKTIPSELKNIFGIYLKYTLDHQKVTPQNDSLAALLPLYNNMRISAQPQCTPIGKRKIRKKF